GRHILKAFLLTMCEEDPVILENVRIAHVILRTERYLAELPFFYFVVAKISFYLIEYALPPLGWKLLPFSRLSLEKRIRYLAEWQGSNFYPKRILFKTAASVCLAQLYSERRLLSSLGFENAMQKRISHEWS